MLTTSRTHWIVFGAALVLLTAATGSLARVDAFVPTPTTVTTTTTILVMPQERGKRKHDSCSAGTTTMVEASGFDKDLELTRKVLRRFWDNGSKEKGDSYDQEITVGSQDTNGSQSINSSSSPTKASASSSHTTQPSYEALAERVAEKVRNSSAANTWFGGIAGGPGAGKSTLARRVSKILEGTHGISSVVVDADGYAYTRAKLASMAWNGREEDDNEDTTATYFDLLRRRGAPHTIDAEALAHDVTLARKIASSSASSAEVWFPGLDHQAAPSSADPIPNTIRFDPSEHQVVFVVGDYLLLGKEGMVPGYVTQDEGRRWRPLGEALDETWFLTCQPPSEDEHAFPDFAEQRQRRIDHYRSCAQDSADTIRNLFPYLSSLKGSSSFASPQEAQNILALEVATKRADSNDVLNMHIAEFSKKQASIVVTNVLLP